MARLSQLGERCTCGFAHTVTVQPALASITPIRTLLPSPALLALLMNRRISIDEYLLWSIAEGGTQFETAMPAFKGVLTREEIWKIIVFMRAGFAAETPPSAKP